MGERGNGRLGSVPSLATSSSIPWYWLRLRRHRTGAAGRRVHGGSSHSHSRNYRRSNRAARQRGAARTYRPPFRDLLFLNKSHVRTTCAIESRSATGYGGRARRQVRRQAGATYASAATTRCPCGTSRPFSCRRRRRRRGSIGTSLPRRAFLSHAAPSCPTRVGRRSSTPELVLRFRLVVL